MHVRTAIHRAARRRLSCVGLATALLLGATFSVAAATPPQTPRQSGVLDGLWYWVLPNTPNGLHPNQSWSGASSLPDGGIIVGGMNHIDNAALYRVGSGTATVPGPRLTYVGDARTAAAAANNLEVGEPIEKFHTKPAWVGSKVYVANLDWSLLDDTYLQRRGFHWFRYDTVAGTFKDLSANQPGKLGAVHGGLISLVADRPRSKLYGLMAPTGDLYRYTIGTGVTTKLGRPAYGRPFVYPARTLWTSSKGRVYFTAGSNTASGGAPYDPAIFNHVHYWDPTTGFGEMTGWKLHDQRAIDTSQCFDGPRQCFLMDNVGHVYRYGEKASGTPTFAYLGSIGQLQDELYGATWVFHVTSDRHTAYILSRRGYFFSFNLITGVSTKIGFMGNLEPSLAQLDFYGFDAWDKYGRFYFTAFEQKDPRLNNVKLVAIDPARFIAAASK